ncbi:MAG: type II toxin-antitoxin system VapC family toxin, partial [Gammaproteobacteria bacterium]|nr:type II toxin-antitoxin system VapC family toxin [Gammaproteobacteria bacterium]
SYITILPFGLNEANESAKIRAALEKEGQPIGPYDVLIAGTARANNATLVTHNVKEFKRIKNLQITDWY